MSVRVLGISAFYHDSAAALVCDGVPIAAAQEERFTRVRQDRAFPARAVEYCLRSAGLRLDELTNVVFYEDPQKKFRRVLSSFASAGIGGMRAFSRVLPEWLRWKRHMLAHVDGQLTALGLGTAPKAVAASHHRSHAAASFFPSPFASATVLCIDGVGEWDTTTIWRGAGNSLELIDSISYPHSLGLLYSAFTFYCGFKVDSGEYKLMGLAPYGEPVYERLIREHLVNVHSDASFSLNLPYFEFLQGERMLGKRFERLFGQATRAPESPITQFQCDIAASIQKVTEDIVAGLAAHAIRRTGEANLCLGGGVALNCVANGLLSRANICRSIWVQPAAGDAGCALGAALDAAIDITGRPHLRTSGDAMRGALLGPGFSDADIEAFLTSRGYPHERFEGAALYDVVADRLARGEIIGWFQDRMEFGPRALGARSILGDPRVPDMQKRMNLKIKFRESFRPFAPAVLSEDMQHYFDLKQDSPYMLLVAPVRDAIRYPRATPSAAEPSALARINEIRSQIPAVTHIDYSARVQTVTERDNPHFARLLEHFKRKTGCAVLVNTSFNVRGEPIVCTPQEAYACFMRTHIDTLVLGSFVLQRSSQPAFHEDVDWRSQIPLD